MKSTMNNDNARFILRSYRASGADGRDPVFAEALEHASRDPELEAWLAEERSADRVIQTKLASIPPPASLRGDILSALTVTTARSFWRRPRGWLAVAAALAVVIGGTMIARTSFVGPSLSLAAFPEVAATFVSGPIHLEKVAASLDEVRQWMGTMPALSDAGIPSSLQGAVSAGVGCKSFSWRGQKVALLCFEMEDGRIAHFFVMDARDLPGVEGSEAPQVARHGEWITTTWVEGDFAYVLASSSPLKESA